MTPLSLSSRTARAAALALWLILAVAWGSAVSAGVNLSDVPAVLGSIAGVGLSWLVLWRPRVVVSETALTIVNPLRHISISWAAITGVDTARTMRVSASGNTFSAWAVVAPGRHAGFWASRDQTTHLPRSSYSGNSLRPGDLIGTESGEIAAIVRGQWEKRRETPSEELDLSIHWSQSARVVALASAVVAIAATVVGILSGR